MGNKAASVGQIPDGPGFYWYIPGALPPVKSGNRPTERAAGICELREGENVVRFTDGSRQGWAHPQDQFFGPLQPPNTQWTAYWRDGRKSLLVGETIEVAFRDAGYGGGALGALDFYARGDDQDYTWDAAARRWTRVIERAAS